MSMVRGLGAALRLGIVVGALGVVGTAAAADKVVDVGNGAPKAGHPAKAGDVSAEDAETLYALGVIISHNLDEFQLSPAEFERVKAGLMDGFNHRVSGVDLTADTPKVQALRRQRGVQLVAKREQQGRAYLDKLAAAPGATKSASGAVLIPIKAGTGGSPGAGDQVTVQYEGKLIDGTVFDSSVQRGQPATFSLSGVIPCWAELLPRMKVGGKSRLVCPPDLAYGVRGSPPKIAPQSTLDFEVELLSVTPGSAAAPQPAPTSP